MNNTFGYEYTVDANNCDIESISSVTIVKLFFVELTATIDMKLYYHENLKMQVHRYGSDKNNYGITGICPILTSSIMISTIHNVETLGPSN